MRQHYILFDTDGNVEGAGFGTPPEGAVIMDTAPLEELARLYVDGENGLVPRPVVLGPVFSPEGGMITIPECPEGTRVVVTDMIGDEILFDQMTDVDTGPIDLEFADTGRYAVQIEPPEPYLGHSMEFTQ